MSRVVDCDRAIRQGRMAKAQQFADAATVERDLAVVSGDVADPAPEIRRDQRRWLTAHVERCGPDAGAVSQAAGFAVIG